MTNHALTHPWTVNVTKKDGKEVTKPKYRDVPMNDGMTALWEKRRDLLAKVKQIELELEAEATVMAAKATLQHNGATVPMVPNGFVAIFGYNFGKFALAAIPAENKIERKAKAAKEAVNWGDAEESATESTIPDMPAELRRGKRK